MGKTIRQRRHAAQPRRPQNRRHVVHRYAQVGEVVGWARRAIPHFKGLRHGLNRSRQQEREGRCGIRWIRCFKVIRSGRAIRVNAALHRHQLGRAFGLPLILLLSRELDSHRCADRARQQRGVCRDVIRPVAAIAPRRFHANDVHLQLVHCHQLCDIRSQHVWILRAGPQLELRT